ncbi:LNS2 domain-containing protein [Actinoplanes couchii]|uniref:Uncharacterized protein n=1 Tax=Actinoplanes couchii TaxID=403638 RepID=A0ABQ3XK55_9ACTN|nr:hypothetical protein [Actinoplanes couchii]MDR6320469.1 hypothetical protein [Actinoplanes couchii]GID58873.1 hypothetical protein Aco03nite_072770 [Actinoplanes couchii]
MLDDGVALVREYAVGHRIVWLTGRPERLRRVTEKWFADHGLPAGTLLMRPDHDRRPARDYKLGQLRKLGSVAVVVDDDPAVVRTLEKEGFPVRLADWVGYQKSLREAQERDGRT